MNEIRKQIEKATTTAELVKFLEVEKHYPELSNEERESVRIFARLKIQLITKLK